MSITAADVKALRDRTGAAMMDAKSALVEADGDVDRAVELLRVKGQASAAKREGRGTNEGVVASYIHANDKVGAMVEVQCETDFVARNEEFKVFAYQVALHAAATAPQYVTTEEIPEEEREAEKRVFEEKAREEGKPDNVVEKIVQGQLNKWAAEVALLDQTHVNAEKHDSKTIE
ncbi:MAG TPA: translation elongation factor Ts, partial [Solirubrobacterales bacterium]